MWSTNSLWFEVAVVSIIFALGNMIFGHFEERTSKLRKIGKYILTLVIVISLSVFVNRTVAMLTLGIFFLPVLYIHIIYLPRKGINGWTGEPKRKYYEFRGWDKNIF